MTRLLRLYPRWWRERYGAEFADLVADMAGDRGRIWSALDIVRGALDAHLHGRPGTRPPFADTALRRGAFDGSIISGALAAVAVLTNVVFPRGPAESDSDPEWAVWSLAVRVLVAVLLVVIGARARRRSGRPLGGATGGATAGVVIAVLATTTFLIIDNLFLDVVSQQHDKRTAFAASGWDSMRAYLTITQLDGAVRLVPALGLVGAGLGLLGGVAFRPRPNASP